ncbi:MAG: 9-O-acetylesterase, partial [Bacteroidales bacterium]|nr:9-O-acetylesterase [Bacteroidales bacterium]
IEGFEVAGEDRVFHKATASYKPYTSNQVIVSCPEVENPVAVRYCFRDFLLGNLSNAMGLPVFPFRSDNW